MILLTTKDLLRSFWVENNSCQKASLSKLDNLLKCAGANYAITGEGKQDCRIAEIRTALWAAGCADPFLDIIVNVTQFSCLQVPEHNTSLHFYNRAFIGDLAKTEL